jgi:hypothetical protein
VTSGLGINQDLIEHCDADIVEDGNAILTYNEALTLQAFIDERLAGACLEQE